MDHPDEKKAGKAKTITALKAALVEHEKNRVKKAFSKAYSTIRRILYMGRGRSRFGPCSWSQAMRCQSLR